MASAAGRHPSSTGFRPPKGHIIRACPVRSARSFSFWSPSRQQRSCWRLRLCSRQNAESGPDQTLYAPRWRLKLHLTELGHGDKSAILVHGLLSDHGAWCRVAPALLERGYRLLMPDLRGHGFSPRGKYTPEAWALDLVETLPVGADLAIGHSLGGMALSLAADKLGPRRAVYVDPAWKLTAEQHRRDAARFRTQLKWDEAQLREANPRWSDEDIAARMASMARFDPRCIEGLLPGGGHDHAPRTPSTRALVMLADPSDLVPPPDAAALRRAGFDVVAVRGAGHSIFRDDLGGFLDALDGWLAREALRS